MSQITTTEPQQQAPECSVYYPHLDNSHRITINPKHKSRFGFTLVELSIVLVIIGLIVGGVLVGRDLIAAAEIRSQISQIEKYQTAVKTFQLKYGYLPGDIPAPTATAFGFAARGTNPGQGDGNGALEGYYGGFGHSGRFLNGEILMFWNDLSVSNLIDGGFNTATSTGQNNIPASDVYKYVPSAKIGNGNFIYISCGAASYSGYTYLGGYNYFTLAILSGTSAVNQPVAANGLSVNQTWAIDSKIDDGLPQSGKVTARFLTLIGPTSGLYWSGTSSYSDTPISAPTQATATSCFDNGNVNGALQKYSTTQNSGTGINCALSFQFQ